MNERIKQLLGQAYDEAVPETWTTLSSLQQGRVYEKFAELIAAEVISKAEDYGLGCDAVEQLKEDFGVEECL